MARTTPTYASPRRIVTLCWLAVFAPTRFAELERQDSEILNRDSELSNELGVQAVRHAYASSAMWGASAAVVGAILGLVTASWIDSGKFAVAIAASAGTAVLLWATLAVQGWKIQTWGGVSLTERVNQWYFRGLYWLGTMLIVVAAVWSSG